MREFGWKTTCLIGSCGSALPPNSWSFRRSHMREKSTMLMPWTVFNICFYIYTLSFVIMTRDLTRVGQVCVSRKTFVVCAQNYTKLSSSCPSSWPATTQEAVAMTSWPRASWFAIRTAPPLNPLRLRTPVQPQWGSTAGKDRAIWGARHKRRRNRTHKMQLVCEIYDFFGGSLWISLLLGIRPHHALVRWVNHVCFSPTLPRTIYPERHWTPECWMMMMMMMLDEISSAAPPREIVTPQSPLAGFTISASMSSAHSFSSNPSECFTDVCSVCYGVHSNRQLCVRSQSVWMG